MQRSDSWVQGGRGITPGIGSEPPLDCHGDGQTDRWVQAGSSVDYDNRGRICREQVEESLDRKRMKVSRTKTEYMCA